MPRGGTTRDPASRWRAQRPALRPEPAHGASPVDGPSEPHAVRQSPTRGLEVRQSTPEAISASRPVLRRPAPRSDSWPAPTCATPLRPNAAGSAWCSRCRPGPGIGHRHRGHHPRPATGTRCGAGAAVAEGDGRAAGGGPMPVIEGGVGAEGCAEGVGSTPRTPEIPGQGVLAGFRGGYEGLGSHCAVPGCVLWIFTPICTSVVFFSTSVGEQPSVPSAKPLTKLSDLGFQGAEGWSGEPGEPSAQPSANPPQTLRLVTTSCARHRAGIRQRLGPP
jgi:hypothetical protein